ncbi:MAG: response regulator [Planctomycetota bacterium]|jgi:CheY-like chemotaxis protein
MEKSKNKKTANIHQKGLSLGKVGNYCGVTRKTILRWIKEGMMDSFVLPSGHHRVMPKTVAEFLHKHGMPVPENLLINDEKPTVLVVDDEEDVRRFIIKIIQDKYNIREAKNGIEACLSLGKKPYDLLILDIKMPKMDGIDLCREVKRDENLKKMKIMVVSAYLNDSVNSKLEGLIDYSLAKPFNTEDLLINCEKLLGV